MTARGLVAAAIFMGSLWVGGLFWLIGPPFPALWGGTTARCKAAGFVTGNTLIKADLDCLDTSPRNEFNSQIDANNVKGDAGIQGFKTDQTFSRLVSTGPMVLAAPSFAVSNLSSANTIMVAAPGMTLSSLGSTSQLISVSTGLFVGGPIQLTSRYTAGQASTPNTIFADTIVKAYISRASCSSSLPVGISSFNASSATRSVAGLYSIDLSIPMLNSGYLVLPTVHGGAGFIQATAEAGQRAFTMRAYGIDGTQADCPGTFSVLVIGAQ